MLLGILLVISILVQVAATWLLVRLMRMTRRPWGWYLIGGAFTLMILRRVYTLFYLDLNLPASPFQMLSEFTGLATSGLMFYGLSMISPMIQSLQRSRDALRQGERRYRMLFQHMYNGFLLGEIILDDHGEPCDFRYLLVNPAFETLTGLKRDDVIGRRVREVLPQIEEAWIKDFGHVALTGEPREFERLSDELTRTYQVYVFCPEAGRFAVVFSDTSERRCMQEEALKFKRICDAANYGVTIMDMEGVVQYVNRYQAEILGYEMEEMIGRPATDFYVQDGDGAGQNQTGNVAVAGRVTNRQLEVVHRSGTILPMLYNAILLRDEKGAPQFVAATAIDLREIKSLEQQLRQSQKMESIGQLAGGVAHDFNNFLMAILGFSEMAMSELQPGHPAHEMLGEILKSAERGGRLVQQLMAFSRKQKLKMERLDLAAIVRESTAMVKSVLGANIELVAHLCDEPVPLIGDSIQLQQILMNLAVNARDAMDGSGWLTIECATVYVEEPLQELQPGEYAVLSVNDTGSGIPVEIQDRIFEPFFTTKGLHHGTGLGLSTVHGIVKQMGGDILIESETGKGATFRVYLPSGGEGEGRETEDAGFGAALRGTETILLVEDDAPVRDLTRRILERAGYTVLEADGCGEATRLFETHAEEIALLLSDVIMPVMNGKDLYLTLLQQKPNLKVIFMSGYTNNVMLDQGINVESTRFLPKPFPARALLERVREVLNLGEKSESRQ